LSGPEGSRKLR